MTTETSDKGSASLKGVRSGVLYLSIIAGQVCQAILNEDGKSAKPDQAALSQGLSNLLKAAIDITNLLSISLQSCIKKKITLNGKKYPVELCKGKAGKYTDYSDQTGITKTEGQSTLHIDGGDATESLDIEAMSRLTREFAESRGWIQYHTPRNLALSLMAEVGELCEILQYAGDDDATGDDGNKKSVAQQLGDDTVDRFEQELADVAIYAMRIADVTSSSLQIE